MPYPPVQAGGFLYLKGFSLGKGSQFFGETKMINKSARSIGRIVLLISVILYSSCFLLPREEEILAPPLMKTPEITYTVIEPNRGTIENILSVTGNFVTRDQVAVYFAPEGGYIKELYVREGDYVQKGQLLAELDTDELEYNYRLSKLALKKAELNIKKSESGFTSPVDKELAQIALEEQQLRTERAQEKLVMAQLFSPIEGEIVYKRGILVGEYIESYKSLYHIAPPQVMEVRYQGYKHTDFVPGMEVQIEYDRVLYKGNVVQTPRNTPYEDLERYKETVFVRPEVMPEEVRRGGYCTIKAVLEKSEDTIILPRNVVQKYSGRSYVYILEEGIRKERVVETGIQSSTEVEIIKGVELGEKVIKR
jgi:macrolide-specific efflux system membrane fusion protein